MCNIIKHFEQGKIDYMLPKSILPSTRRTIIEHHSYNKLQVKAHKEKNKNKQLNNVQTRERA